MLSTIVPKTPIQNASVKRPAVACERVWEIFRLATTVSGLRSNRSFDNEIVLIEDIPAAVSQPHFYNGDPSLLEEVDGLKPEKEKHQTILAINPVKAHFLTGAFQIFSYL